MQPIILKPQVVSLAFSNLSRVLRLKPDREPPADLMSLISEAEMVAAPKAILKPVFVEKQANKSVILEGISFHSHILRTNLETVYRVFPFIATAGLELYDWASQFSDMLLKFWADTIQEQYLALMRKYLHDEVLRTYEIHKISAMTPGSLSDFPLTVQPSLFQLLGEPVKEIGVSLTDSLLMVPIKSVSGIFFPSEQDFTSCMLCPRKNCPGRLSPFDPRLYKQRFKNK